MLTFLFSNISLFLFSNIFFQACFPKPSIIHWCPLQSPAEPGTFPAAPTGAATLTRSWGQPLPLFYFSISLWWCNKCAEELQALAVCFVGNAAPRSPNWVLSSDYTHARGKAPCVRAAFAPCPCLPVLPFALPIPHSHAPITCQAYILLPLFLLKPFLVREVLIIRLAKWLKS